MPRIKLVLCLLSLFLPNFVLGGEQDPKRGSVTVSMGVHNHQPIYLPAPVPGTDRVQTAAESYDIKAAGGGLYPGSDVPHPQNNLAQGDKGSGDPVFSNPDRVQAYQGIIPESVRAMSRPNAGLSVSYSGSLMEGVQSWGKDNRFGYRPDWNRPLSESRQWRTTGGNPKVDLVGFTYHHSLAPLLPKSVFRKELQTFKEAWVRAWGGKPNFADFTKGYFPTEAAFSESLIPILLEEGFEWTIIANGHLARTCENYLTEAIAPDHSTSTWNTNPPNRADMNGPVVSAAQWWSGTIDGRGAKLPAPFAYQPHKVRYIDPQTGREFKMTAVPMDDPLSYMNGYGPMGTDLIDKHIAPHNDPNNPSLVLMIHDGDNAWGGGNSFYLEATPRLVQEAVSKGYDVSTIQERLNRYPVPENDVVHVEDGGWINPEGDWGDPQFVKWLYPPARSPRDPKYNSNDPRTFIDIENGFSGSWRNWAVIIAGANYCETAEQIYGSQNVSPARITQFNTGQSGNGEPNPVELGWRFYLAGLDSGFMYYGDSLDDEVKSSFALNQAAKYLNPIIRSGADKTPPTVLKPQRWPHNPGGMGWGVTTHYQDVGLHGRPPFDSDFYIWSLIHDVSGVESVTLRVRVNKTDKNSIDNKDNKTYAGGPTVGEWLDIPMNRRVIDSKLRGDPPNPNLNYFVLPEAIADHYWAKVTGFKNVLLDYYIEAIDRAGNITKTDIQHVWVGSGPK